MRSSHVEVGLPGRILHGLWSMAQVARAATNAAGGDPTALRSPERAVPRDGADRAGDRDQRRGQGGGRRRRDREARSRAGRRSPDPQRQPPSCAPAEHVSARAPRILADAERAPGTGFAASRRGIPRRRRARGLQGAVGRLRLGTVDDPSRARQPRGAGAAAAPTHVCGSGPDRVGVPLLRRQAAAGQGRIAAAGAVARAARDRRGDAGHDRDASPRSPTSWRSSPRRRSIPPRSATSSADACSRRC